jgi:exportin-2 (importin alpha re-exporter)
VCKNPTVPGFNHFLFESVAALIANTAVANKETVATLEGMLFPAFEHVLREDVQVSLSRPFSILQTFWLILV